MTEQRLAKRIAHSEEKKEKKEYSFEVIETCEDLYIYKQKTYEEISKITDVPVVTVQRWSARYEWRKHRMEYVRNKVGRRRELYVLKDQLIKDAKDGSDQQAVYKLAALQKTIEAEERGEREEQKIDRLGIYTEFMRDLVTFLKDCDPAALAALEKYFDEFISFAREKYAA